MATNAPVKRPAASTDLPAKVVPAPTPALTRSDFVSAAEQAASAYAKGDTATSADPLVGRSFAVRLPFGCTGPATPSPSASEDTGLAGWTWGQEGKTVHLRMTPSDWTGSALLVEAGTSEKWEAVEGFWIPRPWIATESCPAVQADPLQTGAPASSPQTVGIAAVFDAGGSRLGRRNGRAYEYVIRAKGDAPLAPPEKGFRLLLEGRVGAFPGGRAIACRASGPDQRPVCVVAVRLDRVSYEDPAGKTLSEWRPG